MGKCARIRPLKYSRNHFVLKEQVCNRLTPNRVHKNLSCFSKLIVPCRAPLHVVIEISCFINIHDTANGINGFHSQVGFENIHTTTYRLYIAASIFFRNFQSSISHHDPGLKLTILRFILEEEELIKLGIILVIILLIFTKSKYAHIAELQRFSLSSPPLFLEIDTGVVTTKVHAQDNLMFTISYIKLSDVFHTLEQEVSTKLFLCAHAVLNTQGDTRNRLIRAPNVIMILGRRIATSLYNFFGLK